MKICFWGDIASAIKGETIGGGELQISLLAKSLAIEGHDVVIIDPFSKESFITKEGVKIIHVPAWNKGIPFIRMFWNRIPSLYKALKKQKADFYYIRMRSYFHLLPYIAARKTGGKVILALAHDLDIASFLTKFRYEYGPKFNLIRYLTYHVPNDLVFKYILKRADYITLQHTGQKINPELIRGKQAVFPNIFDFSSLPKASASEEGYYVCAGSLTMLKGAGNLLKLLKENDKSCKIVIVGEPRGKTPEKIYKQLKKMPNVELKGRLPHKETVEIIGKSKALINMSNFEGFPNIFLEAWAQGVPVISLNVNPGNVINENHLGLYCDGDKMKMKDYIDHNSISSLNRRELILYTKRVHDFNSAAVRFLSILNLAAPYL